MKSFIINSNDANQRVDRFITKSVPLLPASMLYKYIRLKRIKLNGKRCEISTRLLVGDILELYINDEFFGVQNQKLFLSAPISLNILYEDEHVLLIDKKPGLIVHEDDNHQIDTLINRILHYLYEKGCYNPDDENSFIPSLCNRIDLNTGGIVIAAKNAPTLRILNEKIKQREVTKQYLSIVHGKMPKTSDTIKAFLLKDSNENKVEILKNPVKNAKTIVTRYRVLAEKKEHSLVEVDLLTGRTHQIRAHLASIGNPLLGDTKYGLAKDNKKFGIKYQALYSYKLTFSFTTDAGHLSYLQNKTFEVKNIWFKQQFYQD